MSHPTSPALISQPSFAVKNEPVFHITALYLDIEAKLASLFAKTKNVNWNIMLVFCFAKGTKSKTHVIAAIHIYLRDSCHQEKHQ